ncbi:WD40 repeat-like protein [Pluteus cervinus]|uniref:WD40 repeat-like protein n=1 Tax=Pluteus cervinus TaxID=181527 RepID=A0ACD3B010_9AGAR|nr:WD40 repeat-like protein [Pluteus cervinus]
MGKHPAARASVEIGRPTKRVRIESETKPKAKQQPPKGRATPPPPPPSKSKGKGKEKEVITEPPPRRNKTAAATNTSSGSTDPSRLPTSFKVVAGSYEKLLYGLDGTISLSDDLEPIFTLKPIFIFPAHVSCIKAVAASPEGGKWLATGSSDEIVKVWDLRRRKEIGGLMHHEGSITYLHFPSRSHLLSASEDGTLCLFRARDWSVLRALKGHKGRVNCIAVHPSGKLALSVGKDRTLRMWDFMRGKGVASTKLGKEGEVVQWSLSGTHFVVQWSSTLELYATNMTLIHIINHPSRIHDVKFCKRLDSGDEALLVGAEDKKVSVYDNLFTQDQEPKLVAEFVGHSNRIKALKTLDIALPSGSKRPYTTIVCTVSSDGKIHIYDLSRLPPAQAISNSPTQIDPVSEYDSKGTRLTCLTLAEGDPSESSKSALQKREHSDSEDSEEENNEVGSQDAVSDDESKESGSEDDEEEEGEGEEEFEEEGESD